MADEHVSRADDGLPIPLTCAHVVDDRVAVTSWREFQAQQHRRIGVWIWYAVVLVILASLMYGAFGSSLEVLPELALSVAAAFAGMVVILPAMYALAYRAHRRSISLRWHEGAVLESGFGKDAFVFRSPLESSCIRYEAIESLKVGAHYVFIRVRGRRRAAMYPRSLFPDSEVERIRHAIAGR